MPKALHVVLGLLGAALIVWGCEYLPRFVGGSYRQAWLGPTLIISGVLLSWYACAKFRGLAVPLGIVLIGFGGMWLWNMHYILDPSRFPKGYRPDLANWFLPAGCLIVIGTFFCVLFRYWRPPIRGLETRPMRAPSPLPEAEPPPTVDTYQRTQGSTVWYRLALLGCSVVLAVAAGWLVGSDQAEERTKVFLGVLAFGAVATGLIRESTLASLISKSK